MLLALFRVIANRGLNVIIHYPTPLRVANDSPPILNIEQIVRASHFYSYADETIPSRKIIKSGGLWSAWSATTTSKNE